MLDRRSGASAPAAAHAGSLGHDHFYAGPRSGRTPHAAGAAQRFFWTIRGLGPAEYHSGSSRNGAFGASNTARADSYPMSLRYKLGGRLFSYLSNILLS